MNAGKARATIAIGADSKQLDRDLAAARKKLKGFKDGAKKLGGKLFGSAKEGASALLGGFGIQASEGITAMISDITDVEKQLTRLQIAGEMSAADLAAFRNEMGRVSVTTGIARAELVKGAAEYVKLTGDAKGAQESMRLFAEVAAGSGAAMEDIAGTAAALRQNLKIDPSDFRPAFDVLVKQGKLGAVEISELASQMAKVAPQFSAFANSKTVNGMADLGAMLQVTRQAFGSTDEAMTGFNGMMTQLYRNQKKLKGLGVNVVDAKTKKPRELLAIIKDIAKNKKLMATGGLLSALGEEKAVRAMQKLIDEMATVEQIKRDSLNSDQVAKDNLVWQASTAGKLAMAYEQVKAAAAAAFTPERIASVATMLTQVLDLATKVSDVFSGLFKMGQDLRSLVSGEGQITFADRVLANAGEQGAQRKIDNLTGIADYARIRAADDPRARKFLGIEAGSAAELAGQYANAVGPGAVAKREAAAKYFAERQNSGPWGSATSSVDVAKLAATMNAAVRELQKLNAKGGDVKMDGSKVGKATGNATSQRTRPGGH